jgi:fused signal recognition particle receptor
MRAHDAGAIRRSVGLLGRLLGRDVEAQAQAERLAGQLDVCLLRADGIVGELQKALPERQQQAMRTVEAVNAIDAWAEAGERLLQDAATPAGAERALTVAALQRRLHHLRGVARLRALEASQLQLLHAQGVELLERYQRIRDVLLPLWRQQMLASKAAGMSARLATAADAQARILAEVEAMQARLR